MMTFWVLFIYLFLFYIYIYIYILRYDVEVKHSLISPTDSKNHNLFTSIKIEYIKMDKKENREWTEK